MGPFYNYINNNQDKKKNEDLGLTETNYYIFKNLYRLNVLL